MTSCEEFIETAFLAASLRQIWNEHSNGLILITIDQQVPKTYWDKSIEYFKNKYQDYFEKNTEWISIIVSNDQHFNYYYDKGWILKNTKASYLMAHLHISSNPEIECKYHDMIEAKTKTFFPRVDINYRFFSKN